MIIILSTIRRLASDILGVGKNKIRIRPTEIKRAQDALTRKDVQALIKDKVIYAIAKCGFKVRNKRKRRGEGSRKGTMNSRTPKKEKWMRTVRAQRKYLNQLVVDGNLAKENKRALYMKIKSGSFRGKKAMLNYLKDNELYIAKTK